jgi:hypothetical protein
MSKKSVIIVISILFYIYGSFDVVPLICINNVSFFSLTSQNWCTRYIRWPINLRQIL